MLSYLLKTLVLMLFSFVIVYFYYFSSTIHIENFDGYMVYWIIIGVIYAVYKFFQFELSEKKAVYTPLKIFGFFLLHLMVLSVLFFTLNDAAVSDGLKLFLKIVFYSILPVAIVISSLSFWRKIVNTFMNVKEESAIYRFLLSLALWFFSFVFFLDILWMLGFYNLFVVFFILAVFIIYSFRELIEIYNGVLNYKIEIDIEEWSYLKLLSAEFLFLVSTLVISVSLISIVRPFPIGWDDLWVYMNFPHLMAEAGKILPLWWMHVWQSFTGIWYMFNNPVQAFFLNNVWWILSFITLVLITSDLLISNGKDKKQFIHLPLLAGTMFITMPMVVFQQAKDMKLDTWLFFVSIIALYLLMKYYIRHTSSSDSLFSNTGILWKIKSIFSKKDTQVAWVTMLIIWILAGFAFSIKFTSLLLISAFIWVIFYARAGIIAFIWYLALFFAVFTKAGLWKMMNVVVNPNNIAGFETSFFLISGWIWIGLLVYAFMNNKKWVIKAFAELWVLITWIIIALFPWLTKNIVESYPNLSIGKILSGTSERFQFDTSKIYSETELAKIKEEKQRQSMSDEWVASNEDFWRYFWYEKWINNYVKLPWNLTMQKNQAGEYTDIWFLFLALIPVVLLFLPFRKKWYPAIIVLALLIELLIFIKHDNYAFESTKISHLSEFTQKSFFVANEQIFTKGSFWDDIYDIDVGDYISKKDILGLVSENTTYSAVEKRAIDLFYKEMQTKVVDDSLGQDIALTKSMLNDSDYALIQNLRKLSANTVVFKSEIDSKRALQDEIIKLNVSDEASSLLSIWEENRSFHQAISDYFSSWRLPAGYIIVFLIFALPVLFFLLTLKKSKETDRRIDIFKLNLVFASFYTFLWTISAFGIVWYGITMYFSFILIIVLWASYIVGYSDDSNEKKFYSKLLGSLVFFLVFLVYAVNSIFPHSFNNLKNAGYDIFKTGEINTINAPYLYHKEYLKILFHTNIDQSKKQEFLSEFINDDLKKAVDGITQMDIFQIRLLLNQIIESPSHQALAESAKASLMNIYKNVSNPPEEYRSQIWIYRIGTFLKYHISENHKRLLEDSLIFQFHDYLYTGDPDTTVDNLKKTWIWYLLTDLNAATIDKDERHNLTNRYEELLFTFTSDKLELIDTDSACLRMALELYKRSEKTSEDKADYMKYAWVNYESYTADNTKINRGIKLQACYDKIIEMVNTQWAIGDGKFNFLVNLKNHLDQNKDEFKSKNEIYKLLQKEVKSWYKALFRVK